MWVIGNQGHAALYALDASDLTNKLYDTDQKARDRLNGYVKFTTPTVANGRVYLGTFDNVLYSFGLPR